MQIKDVILIFPAGRQEHPLFLKLPTQTPVTGCDGAWLTVCVKLVFIRTVMDLIISDLDSSCKDVGEYTENLTLQR